MTGDATRGSVWILGHFVNCPMEGGLVHLFMRMIGAKVANSTGARIFCFVQREAVRGMAAITPFLDAVATFTEGDSDFLRNGKILPLNSHSVKRD